MKFLLLGANGTIGSRITVGVKDRTGLGARPLSGSMTYTRTCPLPWPEISTGIR